MPCDMRRTRRRAAVVRVERRQHARLQARPLRQKSRMNIASLALFPCDARLNQPQVGQRRRNVMGALKRDDASSLPRRDEGLGARALTDLDVGSGT